MPASMMRAETGGRVNVRGSSMAMVAVGPSPGSTPIRVPRNTPARQYSKLIGVSAVERPKPRLESSSIIPSESVTLFAEPRTQHRKRHAQAFQEYQNTEHGESRGHGERMLPAELFAGIRTDEHQRGQRDDKTGAPDDKAEQERRSSDQQ